MKIDKNMTNVFVQERFPIYFQIFEITAQACWPEKNSKTGRKIDLQNLMYFLCFHTKKSEH